MKIIHGQGFRPDEKRRLIPFIYQQIITVVRCICRAMANLRINFAKARNEVRLNNRNNHFLFLFYYQEYAHFLSSANNNDDIDSVSTLSRQMVEAIKNLWLDEGVQACYKRRREYPLTDSAK
jgi:hypothetical protein